MVNPTQLKKIRLALVGAIILGLAWNMAPRLRLAILSIWPGHETDVVIFVADHYIPAYAPITKKEVHAARWPRAFVPPGALMASEELIDKLERPRFTAAVAIPEGQPVSRALVLDALNGESLANLLRPGQVAVSMKVDRAKGAGGWVRPGDNIAVFSKSLPRSASMLQKESMRLIVPSITVLAVGNKRLSPQTEEPAAHTKEENDEPLVQDSALVVTVRANPIEAASLVEASEEGNIHVVVRSLGDELPWTPVK